MKKRKIQMSKLKFNIIILGGSSVIAQLLLFREIYSVIFSNELIFGVMLSLWLMLCGLGTYIGNTVGIKNNNRILRLLHILLALFPIMSIFGIRFSRAYLFESGIMLSLPEITIFSLFWLAPICIVSGMALVQYSVKIGGNSKISLVYLLDLIGAGIGGILFYFLFILIFDSIDALYLILFVNIISALLLSKNNNKNKLILFGILTIVSISVFILNQSGLSHQILFSEQNIEVVEDTPYGRLVITKTEEQYNFFENSSLLFSTNAMMENEEAIHFSLLQLDSVNSVLLISGGIAGKTNEILKYKPKVIDYTELNSNIFKYQKFSHSDMNSDSIFIYEIDGRKFVKNSEKKYDAILINVPSPSNAQLNRYYTIEFFQQAKRIMKNNSILSINLPATVNYVSSEENNIHSVIYNTLKKVFKNVLIIPGIKNYFLASDKQLSFDILKNIEYRNIDNQYVNSYYYDIMSVESRADYIICNIDTNAVINRDFQPTAYYNHIKYWLSYFGGIDIIILILFLFPIVIYAFRANPVNFGLFAGGFTISSVEFVLIISFQIIYGCAYEFIAIIFSVFMFGLAFGAFLSSRIKTKPVSLYRKLLILPIVFLVVLPFILGHIAILNNEAIIISIFIILVVIISVIGGMQFPVAGKLLSRHDNRNNKAIARETFSADYFGASFGAVLTGTILIPLLNLQLACYVIGSVCLLAYIVFLLKGK